MAADRSELIWLLSGDVDSNCASLGNSFDPRPLSCQSDWRLDSTDCCADGVIEPDAEFDQLSPLTGNIWATLAVDSQDRPHVVRATGAAGIAYAEPGDAGWSEETVGTGRTTFVSLALDGADTPHVAYLGGFAGRPARVGLCASMATGW